MPRELKLSLVFAFMLVVGNASSAEQFIEVPTGPANVETYAPFQAWAFQPPAMRYQQVYAASAFTALDPANRYLTKLEFPSYDPGTRPLGYSTNLQVYLSTTTKSPDALSTNFAENVGTDEMLVFAATNYFLPPNYEYLSNVLFLTFPKPFVYCPTNRNLLLEVRTETVAYNLGNGGMAAHNRSTDAVSRVSAFSSSATQATSSSSTGLKTFFHFNPVPSLRIYTSYFGTPTNWFSIEWATQPTVFVLQRRTSFAPNSPWVTLTNAGSGPTASYQRYYFPVQSSGASSYYRLAWEQ